MNRQEVVSKPLLEAVHQDVDPQVAGTLLPWWSNPWLDSLKRVVCQPRVNKTIMWFLHLMLARRVDLSFQHGGPTLSCRSRNRCAEDYVTAHERWDRQGSRFPFSFLDSSFMAGTCLTRAVMQMNLTESRSGHYFSYLFFRGRTGVKTSASASSNPFSLPRGAWCAGNESIGLLSYWSSAHTSWKERISDRCWLAAGSQRLSQHSAAPQEKKEKDLGRLVRHLWRRD